ncbi:uncharacterized protein LOC114537143 [Dendronephthya gigantea]|uniref:uncharacterized protein LOC114537143 n=1 Tax=Dendronephthya gigantea TaxID=151771 RepID=UPI00106D1294|nr:uncharacterized protein LOC114537143 [Dendronephthya gigantea]
MKKPLYLAPKRLQRILLRLQGYDINLVYRSGKNMELSDTLSRAYLQEEGRTPVEMEVESISVMHSLPVDSARLDDIRASVENNKNTENVSENLLSSNPAIQQIRSDDETASSDVELPMSDDVFQEEVEMEIETETETETEDEAIPQHRKVYFNDSNLRQEPKFIVFFTQLLALFNFCHTCKHDNPLVEVQENGTMAETTSTCANPKCGKTNKWFSQPNMPGTKIAAWNFLLSFSILVGGTSATKVLRVFRHMGLKCISLSTFFKHQREKLFPGIYNHWKKYQQGLIEKVKNHGDLVVAGNGRHDSMGHSAKYCAYTVFCCTVPFIIHFALVQRNEVGSSAAMEYHGFVRSIEYLLGCGLIMKTFVSDRHTAIAKHMREKLANLNHYFDIWHLKKVTKVLTKLAKLTGCELISEWIRPCTNHLFWSARTTQNRNGDVIWAKFSSFFSHVVNKHKNLKNPLFNKCAHEDEIQPRKWLDEDSVAYEKMVGALTNTRLMNGIKKASPVSQTSCLEGFHSVLNQFSPKMIGYSYPGMFCRHALAVIHFNENLNRKNGMKDGVDQVHVIYPKFKNGEAVVRDVKVEQTFNYVDEIYNTMADAIINKNELEKAMEDIKKETPLPMNTMLEKQPRNEAIEKKKARESMSIVDVPPTNPVPVVAASSKPAGTKTRKRPRCKDCNHLMQGHKDVKDCPRNKK